MITARFEMYLLPGAGRAGAAGSGAPAHTMIAWRLLSGNNRDLGRAATWFPDEQSCAAAILLLRERVGGAERIAERVNRMAWHWQVRTEGFVLARSSRAYPRQIQTEASCAMFVDLASVAPVVAGIRPVRSRMPVRCPLPPRGTLIRPYGAAPGLSAPSD